MTLSPLPALPVRRSLVDRDAPTRLRPDAITHLLADPTTRILVLRRGAALASAAALHLLRVDELPAGAIEAAHSFAYLGRSLDEDAPEAVGAPIVMVSLGDDAAQKLEQGGGPGFVPLRAFRDGLGARDLELLATGLALSNWHASHGFSPRTGAATAVQQSGWVRLGSAPEHQVFPRTDPSVIVAVLDADDRILLGSNALWEANRFSLLAGFVEPGESLEAAVEREIFEESGIRVTEPHYLGSQPWPAPLSLMLGFSARVDESRPSRLTPDGEEILELRWFSRDELAGALGEIILPGRLSIARAIIEHWYGGRLDDGDAVGQPR